MVENWEKKLFAFYALSLFRAIIGIILKCPLMLKYFKVEGSIQIVFVTFATGVICPFLLYLNG